MRHENNFKMGRHDGRGHLRHEKKFLKTTGPSLVHVKHNIVIILLMFVDDV